MKAHCQLYARMERWTFSSQLLTAVSMLMLAKRGSAERGEAESSRAIHIGPPDDTQSERQFVNFLDAVGGNGTQDNSGNGAPPEVINFEPVDEEGRQPQHGGDGRGLDQATLQKAQQELNQVIADTEREIRQSLESFYTSTKESLQAQTQEMLSVVKSLHADSSKRVELLTQRERRLEIAMKHGEYGKCCCTEPNKESTDVAPGQCTWSVGAQLLGKFSKKCDMDKLAYTEFLGQAKDGGLEDRMLDECGQTSEWLQYTSNQIVNDCDEFSQKLDRDITGLSSYLR